MGKYWVLSYLSLFGIRIKYDTNTEIFRQNMEFRKYDMKNSVSTSVCVPTTSTPNSEPSPIIFKNAKNKRVNIERTDDLDREKLSPQIPNRFRFFFKKCKNKQVKYRKTDGLDPEKLPPQIRFQFFFKKCENQWV